MQEMPYVTGKYISCFKITMRTRTQHRRPSEILLLCVNGRGASFFLLEYLFLVRSTDQTSLNLVNVSGNDDKILALVPANVT
jgi:hypothetical protein